MILTDPLRFLVVLVALSLSPALRSTCAAAPGPCVPSARQLAWATNEFEVFIHFGVNSLSGEEWGGGREDPARFNPAALDAGQWVRAIRAAGATGLVLVAKHHDGFCLWPSRFTEHSVRRSPWRGGQGDLVREVAGIPCLKAGGT